MIAHGTLVRSTMLLKNKIKNDIIKRSKRHLELTGSRCDDFSVHDKYYINFYNHIADCVDIGRIIGVFISLNNFIIYPVGSDLNPITLTEIDSVDDLMTIHHLIVIDLRNEIKKNNKKSVRRTSK